MTVASLGINKWCCKLGTEPGIELLCVSQGKELGPNL